MVIKSSDNPEETLKEILEGKDEVKSRFAKFVLSRKGTDGKNKMFNPVMTK